MALHGDTILSEDAVFTGKYQILSVLGTGAFGHVYLARQLSTGQLVAVKVMRFSEDRSEETIRGQAERFRREAQLCAELSHPNLVVLVDSGVSADGQFYAVFEYVPGQTLADVLAEEGKCEPRESLRLMIQVLDALTALHRRGIVHRDLKPANIMVTGTGTIRNAKLLDLGTGGFADTRRDQMLRLTAMREFVGTPLYAAPEQLQGEPASARSDLYSWGLVFLECLTGMHPFPGVPALQSKEINLPLALAGHPVGKLIAKVTRPDPAERDIESSALVRELERMNAEELEALLGRRSAPSKRAVRRQISVLSCRLEIASARPLDVEDRDRMLRAIHGICEEAAARYGGHLASTLGDRIILHFGYPVARESDARRAALAALRIAEEVSRHKAPAWAPGDLRVDVHLGLHTGPVIAREVPGNTRPGVPEVVGTTPQIATQLDMHAGRGEVVVSDTTRRRLDTVMATVPIGPHHLGELSRPVLLHRLVPGAAPHAAEDAGTHLVGRDEELGQLLETWERVRKGRSRCVVVRGEAGIGKSRLLREFRSRLEEGRWLECRCMEETIDTPLGPVSELFRSLNEPLANLLHRYGLDVPTTVPLFRSMLGLSLDEEYPKAKLSPERESSMLIETLATLLIEISLDQPTVVVCEDLHWADPTTRGLLAHLLDRLRREDPEKRPRLFLVFTTRDWAPTDASLVVLAPLSRDEVVELVRTGLASAESLSPQILDLIIERSDGVPLFVEEVTRALKELRLAGEGSQSSAVDPIPENLEALLQARLDTLSDRAREIAQIAAALGREFDYGVLCAVVDYRKQDALQEDLAELARSGLLLSRHTRGGTRHVFRHALMREAAYQTMLRDARRTFHARIANVLEQDFPEIATAEPQKLAHHFGEAEEYTKAAAAWHDAGRQALARAAYQEAISCLRKGLQALERLTPSREQRCSEVELLESLGMAYYSTLGYAAPQVEETFRRAESICEDLGEEVSLQTLYGIWSVRFTQGDIDATAALVSRFLRLAERAEEPLAKLYAHGCYGLRSGLLGDLATADEQLALSTTECEDPKQFPYLKSLPYGGAVHPPAWWAWILCMRGCVDHCRAVRERMQALADALQNAYGHAVAGHFSALIAQELGDIDAAHELAERQVQFSAEQKIVFWQLFSQCVRGWARAHRSKGREGIAEIEQALAVLRALGARSAISAILARLADAQLQAGEHEAGLASVKAGLALAETSLDRFFLSQLHRMRGLLLQGQGDRDGAAGSLMEAIEVARSQGARWFELQAATDLARQLGECGRRQEGHRLLAPVLRAIPQGFDTRPVQNAKILLDGLA